MDERYTRFIFDCTFSKSAKVYTLPIETDINKFSINCKINYYDSGISEPLNWHYDRSKEYKGDTITCVLTTHFEDEENGTPIEETDAKNNPTLSYIDAHGDEQQICLSQNTLTIHVCKDTFHKVLELPKGFKRCAFVMKFSTDPTPSGIPAPVQWALLGAQVTMGHAKLRKNRIAVVLLVLLALSSVTAIYALFNLALP